MKLDLTKEYLEWDEEKGEWTDGQKFDRWYAIKDVYNLLCQVAQKKSKIYKKCPCCYGRKYTEFKDGLLCMQCGYDEEINEDMKEYKKKYHAGMLEWQEKYATFEEFCIEQSQKY